MNLEQIALRIADPATATSAEISMLKELTEKYPYAQLFSILYLKALSNSAHIQFDEELNQHAYRIGDRMKLYDLIHNYTPNSLAQSEELVNEVDENEQVENSLSTENPSAEPSLATKEEDVVVPIVEPEQEFKQDEIDDLEEVSVTPEIDLTPSIIVEEPVNMVSEEPTLDEIPSLASDDVAVAEPTAIGAIISSIFNEIEPVSPKVDSEELAQNSEAEVTSESVIPDEIEAVTSIIEPIDLPQETEIDVTIDSDETKIEGETESEEVYDELDIEIISKVVEKVYSENLEKSLPKIENVEKNIEEKKSEESSLISDVSSDKKSFSSWLKMGNVSQVPIEEVKKVSEEVEVKVAVNQNDELIDKFIKTEPSISRPKKEFYSPTKKAKESVSEDHLIFTETLANIFAIQGNFPKAIYAYEQLILTNPEKKIFFAEKIQELKEKLNS